MTDLRGEAIGRASKADAPINGVELARRARVARRVAGVDGVSIKGAANANTPVHGAQPADAAAAPYRPPRRRAAGAGCVTITRAAKADAPVHGVQPADAAAAAMAARLDAALREPNP